MPRTRSSIILLLTLTAIFGLSLYTLADAAGCCGYRGALLHDASTIVFAPARWLWALAGHPPARVPGTPTDYARMPDYFLYLAVLLVALVLSALTLLATRVASHLLYRNAATPRGAA